MNGIVVGALAFCIMLIMVFVDVPIFLALLSSTMLGFLLVGGKAILFTQLTSGLFDSAVSYTFSVVPLFILLGLLAGETDIASKAFTSVRMWTGRVRGNLLHTTILANAVFGACSGNSNAGNVVFSRIGQPEFEKSGYDVPISLATICASGNLGCLIPPSIPILNVCIIAEISIGTALITGLSSGILLTLMLMLTVVVIGLVSPKKIPKGETQTFPIKQRLASLKLLLPILFLFLIIIGGSFFGWFPPTVGGAFGALAVIIYAICKKMPLKYILFYSAEGVMMFANVFLIITAGKMFGRFVTMCGLADALVNFITTSGMSQLTAFSILMVFFIALGCAMNGMIMVIVCVPIIYPLLRSFGMDDYLICVILVFVGEMGQITPPVGPGVFNVSMVTGVSPAKIFKGVGAYCICYLAAIYLMYFFPNIVLWLPRLLGA